MGRVHDISTKLNAYIQNIEYNVKQAVGTVEQQVLNLNRDQIHNKQQTINDTPILPEYSSRWKAIKGLVYPNLYDTGSFQKNMFLQIAKSGISNFVYLIKSTDWKNEKLTKKYKDIFGISKSNGMKAQQITSNAIAIDLKNKVFK